VLLVSVIVFLTTITAPVPDDAGTAAPVRAQRESQEKEKDASSSSNSAEKEKKSDEPTGSSTQSKKATGAVTPNQNGKSAAPVPKTGKAKKKGSAAAAKAARANRDAEVRVLTQDEMKKPRSAFLQEPGSSSDDRYGEDPDWYDLPAWRKTTFFGLHARGQFFVYVVDCSLSMVDDDRFTRATLELRRSVMALVEPQKFEVIFYNREAIPMPGGPRPRTADLQAKNQLIAWLRLIEPDGGTDPRPAMKQAISLKPDAVFLLSDGEFPEGTVDEVAKLNTRKIPIHCVDLAGGLAGDHLKRIAAASGGQYASRPGSLHVVPPSRLDRP
jgi:hypothetical protein